MSTRRPIELEVAEHAPLLPAAAKQIRDTAQDIESSVVEVCNSFGGLAERAHAGVERAASILEGGDAQTGIDPMLDAVRATLEHLLARQEQSGALSARAVARMSELEAGMQRIAAVLAGISEIVDGTRMLTVNAKIEAARAGELGRGFSVVASAITELSEHTATIGEQATEILEQLSRTTQAAGTDFRALASTESANTSEGRNETFGILDMLAATHTRMRSTLDESARDGRELAADIQKAIRALQFQDRVQQRLMHSVGAIEQVGRALAEALEARGLEGAGETSQAQISEFARTFTMQAERSLLVQGGAQSAPEGAGEVELF